MRKAANIYWLGVKELRSFVPITCFWGWSFTLSRWR